MTGTETCAMGWPIEARLPIMSRIESRLTPRNLRIKGFSWLTWHKVRLDRFCQSIAIHAATVKSLIPQEEPVSTFLLKKNKESESVSRAEENLFTWQFKKKPNLMTIGTQKKTPGSRLKKKHKKTQGKIQIRKRWRKILESNSHSLFQHGRTVADGWAKAILQKPLAIQKCYGLTYRPTDLITNLQRKEKYKMWNPLKL